MSSNTVNLKSFSRPYGMASLITLAAFLTACGGGGGGGTSTPPPPPPPATTYTVGGSVSGLSGSGLTLQDNGGNNLQVAAGATTFVFSTAVATGGAYAVTVATQPTNPAQACTVTAGSGTVAASNVTNVSITCVTGAVTVGGTVSGLTASGLVLQDNGGDNLTVAANATTFTFGTPVTVGAPYAVTILTQPSGQTCAVTGGSGTTPASAVTNVTVTCATQTAQVTGTITGLAATGLVLQDNGGDNLTVAAGATTFTFATPVGVGLPFSVSVLTQPSNPPEVCTVTGGSGTVPAGGTTGITIACVPATFTVGGSVSGLTGTGLVLQDNAGDNFTVAANATSFVFATPLQFGAAYAVTVQAQPTSPAQVCTVGNGSGTISAANVTNVTIACANVGRYVYVVNSIENGNNGDVAAFSINSSNGHLTTIGSNVAADATPTVIAIDPIGPFVYVGNKASSDVSYFEVGNDGSLSLHHNYTSTQIGVASIAVAPSNQYLYVGGFQGASGGNAWGFNINALSGGLANVPGDPFNPTPDPLTSMVVDPTSSFVFANSGDAHALYAFTIGSQGNLTPVAGSPFTAGVRGGGIAVSPLGTASGGFVYTADNTSRSVSAYSYDATGALTQLGSPYLSGNSPQGIAVDPAGKYLYVTNAADDTVSSYSINATTGALIPIQAGATAVDTGGVGPVDVKVDPSNQFVYVVNQTDGSISTFTTSAGVLTLKGNVATGTAAKAVALAIL